MDMNAFATTAIMSLPAEVRQQFITGHAADGSPIWSQPDASTTKKNWHADFTNDRRIYLVAKMLTAAFPSGDSPNPPHYQRIKDTIQWAKHVERGFFERADDREFYYHLMVQKINKIQKEIAEKKKRERLAGMSARTVVLARGSDGKFGIIHRRASIVEVCEGTSAEVEGVKEGDEIASINSICVDTFTHGEIEKMLRCATGNVTLSLRNKP